MRGIKFAAALAVVLALGACSSSSGGDDPGGIPDVGPVDLGYTDLPEADVPPADVPAPDVPADVPQATHEIVFLSETMFPQQVPAGQTFTIRARVRDTATQTYVAGRQVGFAITRIEALDGEEVLKGDSTLSKASVVSNAEGLVETVFTAGPTVDLLYFVTATAEGAEPALIKLVVLKMECGCLSVTLQYPGTPGSAASYALYALPSDRKCADLTASTVLTGVLAEAYGLDITQPIGFACPPPNTTVTVVAKAVEACPFAFGCVEGVVVTGDKATETTPCPNTATIPLESLEMGLSGTFTGAHRLDVAGVFEDCAGVDSVADCGSLATANFGRRACCYLRAVEQAFASDGAAVLAAIQAQADAWDGTLLQNGDAALLDAALAEVVPGKVAGATPEWVGQFAQVAGRITTALRQINLSSTITFGAEAEGIIPGTIVWESYNPLYWKPGCDPSDPEFFKCGKMVLPMDVFADLPYAPTIADSEFGAALVEGGRVSIAAHQVSLNLGKLAVFFVNDVAARMLTGGYINEDFEIKGGTARSAEQAIEAWIPCAAIAADVMPKVSSWFTGTQTDLETLCKDGARRLLKPAADRVAELTAPMYFEMAGSGPHTDQDCDMNADRVIQDDYAGTFHPAAGTEIEVTGSLTANRK